MIGMNITNYRPDLSLLSRISLWATGILLLASLPMCYMGYRMGNWMMGAAWLLGMFNMIRVEREALLLKQEDMDD